MPFLSHLQDDFHYEFTECDTSGGRWRVSVPAANTCEGGKPQPPKRIQGCSELIVVVIVVV